MWDRDLVLKRLRAYGVAEVAAATGMSRQAVHRLLSGDDIRLSNFLKILEVLRIDVHLVDQVEDEDVLGNLARFGAPLNVASPVKRLLLEETLARSVEVARRESRLSSVVPYVLVHKAYQIKSEELLGQITDSRDLQLFGYLVELALKYRKRAPLEDLQYRIEKLAKPKSWVYLRERDEGKEKSRFRQKENEAAATWKVLTRDEEHELVKRMRRWEKLHAAA